MWVWMVLEVGSGDADVCCKLQNENSNRVRKAQTGNCSFADFRAQDFQTELQLANDAFKLWVIVTRSFPVLTLTNSGNACLTYA